MIIYVVTLEIVRDLANSCVNVLGSSVYCLVVSTDRSECYITLVELLANVTIDGSAGDLAIVVSNNCRSSYKHVCTACKVEVVCEERLFSIKCVVKNCCNNATLCGLIILCTNDVLCKAKLDSSVDEAFGILKTCIAERTNYHCQSFLVSYISVRIEAYVGLTDNNALLVSISNCTDCPLCIIEILKCCGVFVVCPVLDLNLAGHYTTCELCHFCTSYVLFEFKTIFCTDHDLELLKTSCCFCIVANSSRIVSADSNDRCCNHHDSEYQSKNSLKILHGLCFSFKNNYFFR